MGQEVWKLNDPLGVGSGRADLRCRSLRQVTSKVKVSD